MPVVTTQQYIKMLKKARQEKFAFPAINVTSTESANAVLLGLKLAKSDGIIQISTGGAEFLSGLGVKSMAQGAIALAQYIHTMAINYDVNIALHTDHCRLNHIDDFVLPLIKETERRRTIGLPNLFNAHMFDGSELPLADNIEYSTKLLKLCALNDIILEIEIGVVGSEEDGHDTSHLGKDKLYTTAEEMVAVHKVLSPIGNYLLAATFGNVHGVYKPGHVELRPMILKDGQDAIASACNGETANLVFHGGSGSDISDIHEAINYGVVKMNIDTDTQYAFSRAVADHCFKNYNGILKIDGEVGNKKFYDPRSYLKKAEQSMADRVVLACQDLLSAGKSMGTIPV